MNKFLSDDVDKLVKPSRYMKFEQGDNRFRPLDSMITGWVGWVTDKDGNRKPLRFKADENIPSDTFDDPRDIKSFYAFPVWNYKLETVQILEVTQKGIQNSIKSLVRNNDWGSPVGIEGYDITVMREGEGLDTEYSVAPSPHKKIDKSIMNEYERLSIDLTALYRGADPFEQSENINPDEGEV